MAYLGKISYKGCVLERFHLDMLTGIGIQVNIIRIKACITKLCSSVGVTEPLGDQLKSILSQLEYTHVIHSYKQNGVPFRTFMHSPETHPETNAMFYERENEAHLLKVKIAISIQLFSDLIFYRELQVTQEMVVQMV